MIEREYDISGAIVFWSLQPTPYNAVREVFEAMGYADCVPNPRTDQSALENSIKAVYGMRNKTIVSRKQPRKNGVELVNIERSTQRNGHLTVDSTTGGLLDYSIVFGHSREKQRRG
jgi:hypothetical protein